MTIHMRYLISLLFFFSAFTQKSLANEAGTTYAIIIGISTYKEVPSLNFAHRDAQVFADFLLSKEGMGLDPANVRLFLNDKATLANIGNSLSDIMSKNLKKGDRVIFYFAGHGDYDAKILKDQALLLLYGAPKQNYFQNIFSGDFISTADLNSRFIDPVTARGCEVMLIIDACHATGLNKNLSGGAEGGKITSLALQSMTSPIKLYSCQANERSLESEQWGGGRGLFSYVLMEGLYGMADADNNKTVSLRELQRYLEDNVSALALPNRQVPVIKVEDALIPISKVDDKFLSSYKKQKEKGLVFIAKVDTKGDRDDMFKKNNISNKSLYLECDNLIEKQQLDKAYELFILISRTDSSSEPSVELRRNLSAALQEKTAQILLPMFQDVSKSTSDSIKVKQAGKDLEKAASLLGENHFLYKNLQGRIYFLKAFAISFGLGISNQTHKANNLDTVAIDYLEKSISLESNAPYSYYFLGKFSSYIHDYETAKVNYEKYLNLIPGSSYANNNLGLVYLSFRDFEKALYYHLKSTQLDPRNTRALANAATDYRNLKKYDSAIIYSKKAIESDSTYAHGYGGLGNAYLNLLKYDSAIIFFQKAIRLGGSTGLYSYNIACVYSRQKMIAPTLDYFEQALQNKYENLGGMENDRDLNLIRELPEFKKLMEKYFSPQVLAKYPKMFQVVVK